jgi:argininosuccinate lyase
MLNKNTKKSKPGGVWRKRFRRPAGAGAIDFASSLADDERLVGYDLACGLAHVKMLARQKIINRSEARRLARGLDRIVREYRAGKFRLDPYLEDVHMNVERRLKRYCGPVAEKFHTARSRNDLVAADLRLYCRDALRRTISGLLELETALRDKALEYPDAVVPGYTHLQPAQPVLFAFYLMNYFYKFQRDLEGLNDARKRVNVSPLGAGALAGTTHPIDPDQLARSLGFKRAFANALDAVGDRDFLAETLYFMTQAMIHLSSLAEDLVVMSSAEFGRVAIDESYATGSSIMPQKRNPDICELLRAKAGKAIGRLTSLLCVLKGLPQAYNRDLQETKGTFIRQADETLASLTIAAGLIRSLKLADREGSWPERENFCGCTDLVDRLVRSGFRFRAAYDLVAECVRTAEGSIDSFIEIFGRRLGWKSSAVAELLKPKNSVRAKISSGSTGVESTRRQLRQAGRTIVQNRRLIAKYMKEDRLQF